MVDALPSLIAAIGVARQRGNAVEERRLLDAALRQEPDNPQLLNARGMRALGDRDLELARTCFAAAAEQDSTEPVLRINLATVHRALGDDAGERSALTRALSINQLNLTAQLRLAELEERSGRAVEAAQRWGAVVQMIGSMADRSPEIEAAMARGRHFLERHTGEIGAAIDDAIGPALASLGSEARRMTTCIDHMLGRRAIFHNQCAGVHFPFLPADEFFARDQFPWFGALEARFAEIREEALALVREGVPGIRPYVRQELGTPENKWSALDNNTDWSACFLWEYGTRNDEVCARCPETAAALASVPQNDIPGKAPTAFFSILKPHAHIPAHTGVTNTRAIVHLPLVVPPDCAFRVGGETRPWREGEAFAFDDTIEHEAWNRSDEPRIVLIFDVWNPHLTRSEQAMLKEVFRVTGQGGVAP